MKLKNIAAILLSLTLTSCATTGDSKDTFIDVPSNQPHATLSDTTTGFMMHEFTIIRMIDGKKVIGRSFYISPGSHTIKASISKEYFSREDGADLNLSFNAVAGESYHLSMSATEQRLTGWVVDSRGRAVSGKVSRETTPANAVSVNVNELPR